MSAAPAHPGKQISLHLTAAFLLTVSWGVQVMLFQGVNLPFALVLLAASLAVIETLFRGTLRRPVDRIEVSAIAVAFWALLSNFWSASPRETASSSYYYCVCVITFILVRRQCAGRRSCIHLAAAYLAGCVVSTGIIVTRWLSEGQYGVDRYFIEGINSNYTAYALATGIAISASLWVSGLKTFLTRAMVAFAAGWSLVGILLTGCRSGLVSVGAVAAIMAMRAVARRSIRDLVFISAMVTVGIVFYSELPEGLRIRLVTLSDPSYDPAGKNDLSGRLVVWPEALELISKNPILGVGAGAFPSMNSLGLAAHNAVLSLAVELGLVGLLLYAACVANSFRTLWHKTSNGRSRLIAGILFSSWLGIAMAGAWETTTIAWFGFAWASQTLLIGGQADNKVDCRARQRRKERPQTVSEDHWSRGGPVRALASS